MFWDVGKTSFANFSLPSKGRLKNGHTRSGNTKVILLRLPESIAINLLKPQITKQGMTFDDWQMT